jgi:hypothetical protein
MIREKHGKVIDMHGIALAIAHPVATASQTDRESPARADDSVIDN